MRDQPAYQDVKRAMDDKGVGDNHAWDLLTDPKLYEEYLPHRCDECSLEINQDRGGKHNWF